MNIGNKNNINKMIKRYNQFINEGIVDLLTGYSSDEIKNNIKDKSLDEILINLNKHNIKIDSIYTDNEIKDKLKELDNNKLIKTVIILQKFNLLPKNKNGKIIYDGDLDLSSTNIKKLPNNLTIKGALYCSNNLLTELPKNLEVEDSFECDNNSIKKINHYIYFGGDISLRDNNLDEYPNLSHYIRGSLNLSYNNITRLPDGLTILHDLNCSFNNIFAIPDGLDIGSNLNLSYNSISKIPYDLKVGSDINLSYNDIEILPENFKVNGNLYINDNCIEKLPNNLVVYGDLNCEDQKYIDNKLILPKKAKVKGQFYN